jgi:cytochrome P450
MADQQVRDHAMTLLAAGHETTANALTFTFYLLSQHPAVRDRLLRELDTELGRHDPAPEDLARLRYLDLVTRESLRLYPPAWTIGRRAIADDAISGWHLPAGSFVLASQWVVHRMPQYWPEPLRFDPERWLAPEEGGQTVRPFTYFPFGGGPRTCIGMPFAHQELKLITAKVLQRVVPDLVPGQHLVLKECAADGAGPAPHRPARGAAGRTPGASRLSPHGRCGPLACGG